MSKRSKVCDIPPLVKQIVYERDEHRCIVCGSNQGQPNAHYIARSHGGLGIEQNIITMCRQCHDNYDHTIQREEIGNIIQAYLKSKYDDWNEQDLIYNKWRI